MSENKRVILDLNRYGALLHSYFVGGAKAGLIPNLNYDKVFCYNLVVAHVRDVIEAPLARVMGWTVPEYTRDHVVAKVRGALAKSYVETGTYRNVMEDAILLAAIEDYIQNGPSFGLQQVLSKAKVSPVQMAELVRQLSGEDINFNKPSESEEDIVRQIEEILCFFDDIEPIYHLNDALSRVRSENPYDVWSLHLAGKLHVLIHDGDYRIQDWHRMRGE
jgi:hypothetical protein